MTIAKKLYLLIGIIFTSIVLLIGQSIFQINKVYENASFSAVNVVPSYDDLDSVIQTLYGMRLRSWKLFAENNKDNIPAFQQDMVARREEIEKTLIGYEKSNVFNDTDKSMLLEDRRVIAEYFTLVEKISTTFKESNAEEATKLLIANQPTINAAVDKIIKHREYNRMLGVNGNEIALKTQKNANWMSIALGLFALVITSAIALSLTRKIKTSLDQAIGVAEKIADGDLTTQIHVSGNDEIAQLMTSLSVMSKNLENICTELRHSTDAISTASTEIASGNLDLSSRTEQQAGALEETASSMEEMTSTVKQNSDNANHASKLAHTASTVATEGGKIVYEVVDTMGEINDSAKKIVDIISVIDGIAFQTNILALNAAVEAARAGEQGRGFAVVATEVRNLAHRSASAAKEIKTLIDTSVEKVDAGSKLVHQAGVAMSNIVSSIKKVNDVVNEISSANHEQSEGIEQINQAVIQMDETTQQNAALVEQTAAAASSLQDQAHKLKEVVSVFKLNDAGMSSAGVSRSHPVNTNKVTELKRSLKSASHSTWDQPPMRPKISAVSNGTYGRIETADWEEF